jgi:hypothetical protein
MSIPMYPCSEAKARERSYRLRLDIKGARLAGDLLGLFEASMSSKLKGVNKALENWQLYRVLCTEPRDNSFSLKGDEINDWLLTSLCT